MPPCAAPRVLTVIGERAFSPPPTGGVFAHVGQARINTRGAHYACYSCVHAFDYLVEFTSCAHRQYSCARHSEQRLLERRNSPPRFVPSRVRACWAVGTRAVPFPPPRPTYPLEPLGIGGDSGVTRTGSARSTELRPNQAAPDQSVRGTGNPGDQDSRHEPTRIVYIISYIAYGISYILYRTSYFVYSMGI